MEKELTKEESLLCKSLNALSLEIDRSIVEYIKKIVYDTIDQEKKKEAIDFKNWCDSGKEWFFDNLEEHNHTTEQLYDLFKKRNNG